MKYPPVKKRGSARKQCNQAQEYIIPVLWNNQKLKVIHCYWGEDQKYHIRDPTSQIELIKTEYKQQKFNIKLRYKTPN